jgi:hypothetical protein
VNEATKPSLREIARTSRPSEDDSAEQVVRTALTASLERDGQRSTLGKALQWTASALALVAILSSAALLLSDAAPTLIAELKVVVAMVLRAWALLGHAPLSAIPLLLVGSGYIVLQGLLRPAPIELLKRLLLGSAFVLWGIVQLMPPGVLATDLGDLVIALYVLDLGIIIQGELREDYRN